jgi:hypothetical protein
MEVVNRVQAMPTHWRKALLLVEIPFFHEKDLTQHLRWELEKALQVRFVNSKYKLSNRLGKIKVKSWAKVHNNLPPDAVLVEIKDDFGSSADPD